MFPNRKCFLTLLAVSLLLAGCGGLQQPDPKIAYYSLEYDQPTMLTDRTSLPVRLRLENFSASPLLQTNKIVYRNQQYSSNLYFYHRWRVKPVELVTHFLTRDLQQSGLFQAVSAPFSSLPHTHSLEGAVNKFMEWDDDNNWQAVIALQVTLVDANKTQVLFQKEFTAQKPCHANHPREVAAAMSQAMADISSQIATHIHQTLAAPGQQ